jgi:Uma2 family endonuclease
MSTRTLISPEEYVSTRFEWEPEYVHGELRTRPMPTFVHGQVESMLAELLRMVRRQNAIKVATNVRCRLSDDLYLLPDVVLTHAEPYEQVPTIPAIMVAEILSPDDSYLDLTEKMAEYASWGVKHIWLINPWRKELQVWSNDQFATVGKLELPEFGWSCTIEDLMEGIPAEALKR